MQESERLREAATKLRNIASKLDDKPEQVKRDYPRDKYWKGPAADTFYQTLDNGLKQLRDLAGDMNEYARRLEEKAAALDKEAKEQAKR